MNGFTDEGLRALMEGRIDWVRDNAFITLQDWQGRALWHEPLTGREIQYSMGGVWGDSGTPMIRCDDPHITPGPFQDIGMVAKFGIYVERHGRIYHLLQFDEPVGAPYQVSSGDIFAITLDLGAWS